MAEKCLRRIGRGTSLSVSYEGEAFGQSSKVRNPIIIPMLRSDQRLVSAKSDEDIVLKHVSEELRRTHALTDEQKQTLAKVFEKRLPQALALVDARNVTSYRFKPSGRTIWIVKGRKGEYQVVPESMFCTCDDYYFRVMDNKKQLCYHLVAQQIAEALGRFDANIASDSHYSEVTSKWSAHTSSGRS